MGQPAVSPRAVRPRVLFAGLFHETVSFGGPPLTSAGSTDMFLVKLDTNDNYVTSKRFGGTEGHKYINGILDRLAKNVRPDEVAAKRKP